MVGEWWMDDELDLEKGGHNKKRLSYSSAVIMEHKTQICG
jgi:hypothetical protein